METTVLKPENMKMLSQPVTAGVTIPLPPLVVWPIKVTLPLIFSMAAVRLALEKVSGEMRQNSFFFPSSESSPVN